MPVTTLLTAEDFAKIAPLLGPCELVKGEIVHMAPGGLEHSEVSTNITLLLGVYVRRKRLGRVLSNEAGIVVAKDPDTVRGADVAFISYERLPKGQRFRSFLRHRPELVVEVLGEDQSWEKMNEKVADYHAFGVDLVWVADAHTETVRVYPKGGEPLVRQRNEELSGGELLPGFSCKVADFFTD
jgi:Uma2 family endonuclease